MRICKIGLAGMWYPFLATDAGHSGKRAIDPESDVYNICLESGCDILRRELGG